MRVEANAGLSQGRSERLVKSAAAVFCLGAILGWTPPVEAGEKFSISNSTNQVELPKPGSDSALSAPGPFRSTISGGESSRGPALPPPPVPGLLPNTKLQELVDRKKNWAYSTPSSLDRATVEEAFGVRKYELNGIEKKSVGAVERYFGSSKDDKNGSGVNRPGNDIPGQRPRKGRDEYDPTRSGAPFDETGNSQRSGIIEELNPAYLFDWNMTPNSLSQYGSSLSVNPLFPRSAVDGPFGQKLPGQETREDKPPAGGFERGWDSRRSRIGGFADPINDPIDPTRSVINPISARKATVSPSESGSSSMGGSGYNFGAPSTISTRPSFFNGGRSTIPGAPSSRPVGVGPASAPAQPKPMILEIPRPKF